jgi:phosphopantetheinyl transferase
MPIVQHHTSQDGGQTGVWHITEPWEELYSQLSLTPSEHERVLNFGRDTRKQEWLATRLLLKTLTGNHITVNYRPNGAPCADVPDLHISLSHTQNYAAVSLSPVHPVAVDIEYPSQRVLRIADRFLHDDERTFIESRHEAIFQTIIWCAKEALYKWWGETDVIFKEHLRVLPFQLQDNIEMKAFISKDAFYADLTLHCNVTDNYILVYII